jgi:DNA repair exonuclease SbcCD nuclease subunit
MKLVLTTDWHWRSTGMFATPTPDGLSTQTDVTVDFVKWLAELCDDRKIHQVLHAGDFFNVKNFIHVPLFNKVYRVMAEFCKNRSFIITPGNHDRYRVGGEHGIYVLGKSIPGFTVLDEERPSWSILNQEFGLVQIFGIPGGSKAVLPTPMPKGCKHRILLLHENLIGAKFATGYEATEGLDVDELEDLLVAHHFDACFCGDIHVPQRMSDRILLVGSPYQMDFSDEDQKRGVWIYDVGERDLAFVPYEDGPQYMTIDDDGFPDFLEFWDDMKALPPNARLKFRLSIEEDCEWVRNNMDGSNFTVDLVSSHRELESEIALLNEDELIVEYVDRADEENKKELVELGRSYLKLVHSEKA